MEEDRRRRPRPIPRGGHRSGKLIEALRWAEANTGGRLAEEHLDAVSREEGGGPEVADAMAEGYRARKWPGPLSADNATIVEWARLRMAVGEGVADDLYSFRVNEGNEMLMGARLAAALGFVRRRTKASAEATS